MPRYLVMAGSQGVVYRGEDPDEARRVYGRFTSAGEAPDPVVLMGDDRVLERFDPALPSGRPALLQRMLRAVKERWGSSEVAADAV